MKIEMRRAAIEDSLSITSLSKELGYDMTPEGTGELIKRISGDSQHMIYVAVADSAVAGWIHAFITARLESGIFCEIAGMVVSEKYRGKGIGRMLVQHIKDWCHAEKVPVLRVRCNEKRKETHQFYMAQGFRELKTQKVFVMEW